MNRCLLVGFSGSRFARRHCRCRLARRGNWSRNFIYLLIYLSHGHCCTSASMKRHQKKNDINSGAQSTRLARRPARSPALRPGESQRAAGGGTAVLLDGAFKTLYLLFPRKVKRPHSFSDRAGPEYLPNYFLHV